MFFIVCPLVFLGGVLEGISGGGGLVSLPAYLLAGVPVHFALGTNKLSSIASTLTASIRYYKNRYVDIALCLPCIPAALAGSAIGTNLTLIVNERYLRYLLLVILPFTAFYIFKKKNFGMQNGALEFSRGKTVILASLVSLFIGSYDGFFGPGAGTFLVILFTGVCKIDAYFAAGNAKFVNLASNFSSLVLFLLNGRVLVPLGLCAALFGLAGGYLGAGLVIRRGVKVIRIFILSALALLFVHMAYDALVAMNNHS